MRRGIVVFAGQSNMLGYRADPGELINSEVDAKIKYCTYNTSVSGIGNSAGEYGILRAMLLNDGGGNGWTAAATIPAGYSSWGYGPEITCCRALHTEESPIAAVKWALGGQSLEGTFNPSPAGFGYTALKNYMASLYSAVDAEGESPYWRAFVWCQGEEDSENSGQYENYEYNLKRLIHHVRAIAKRPSLSVVIVKTIRPSSAAGLSDVQNAQEAVASTLVRVQVYDPSALPIYSDGVHFYSDAYVTMGNDLAQIIQSM